MTVAKKTKPTTTRSRMAVGIAVLAAVTLGAALFWRGPDPAFLPDMADQPIILSSGKAIYVQR
ncbi:MAG: hypothetical protein AAFY39_01235, partial [Pseudomonadota bacterium]